MCKPEITMYFNCKKCWDELPQGMSMQEYSRTQSGLTDTGLQVWCTRHDCEVVHLHYREEPDET